MHIMHTTYIHLRGLFIVCINSCYCRNSWPVMKRKGRFYATEARFILHPGETRRHQVRELMRSTVV